MWRMVRKTLALFFIFLGLASIRGVGPGDLLRPLEVSAAGCNPTYDFNSDGQVDLVDIQRVADAWHSTDPTNLANYDFNRNGRIDVGDIMLVATSLCNAHHTPFGMTIQSGLSSQVQTLAYQAGVRWIRVGISWRSIEQNNVDLTDPNKGNWPDSTLLTLEANGLSPVLLVMKNPTWAAPEDCGPLYPNMYSEFRQFIYIAAERYDGDGDYNGDGITDGPPMPNVRYWEFYNEPDLNPNKTSLRFDGCWGNKGSEYAKLMREAYLAIKGAPIGASATATTGLATLSGANPSATVMIGGLAYDSQYNNPDAPGAPACYNRDPSNFFNYYFLDHILGTTFGDGTTGGDYFDAINFHYHRKASGCWAPWGKETLGKANYLQNKLASYGYDGINKPRKRIAVTEDGEKRAPSPTYTDEGQARYVVMSFIRALAGNFEVLTWFSLDYYQDHLERVFGLLDQNNNPRPGYEALKVLTAKFEGAQFIENLNVSGVEGYTFSVNGIKKTAAWTSSGSHTISFSGSLIKVYDKYGTLIAQGSGNLSVTIQTDPRYIEVTP